MPQVEFDHLDSKGQAYQVLRQGTGRRFAVGDVAEQTDYHRETIRGHLADLHDDRHDVHKETISGRDAYYFSPTNPATRAHRFLERFTDDYTVFSLKAILIGVNVAIFAAIVYVATGNSQFWAFSQLVLKLSSYGALWSAAVHWFYTLEMENGAITDLEVVDSETPE